MHDYYNPLPAGAKNRYRDDSWKESPKPLTEEERAEQAAAFERGRKDVERTHSAYAAHMAQAEQAIEGMAGYTAKPYGRGPYYPLEWVITGPDGQEVIASAPTAEAFIAALKAEAEFYGQDGDEE